MYMYVCRFPKGGSEKGDPKVALDSLVSHSTLTLFSGSPFGDGVTYMRIAYTIQTPSLNIISAAQKYGKFN